MPRFAFTARDAGGRTRKGVREAPSERAVVEELRSGGLLTLEIEGLKEGPTGEEDLRAPRFLGLWRILRPRPVDMEISLRQLSFMLRSGLSLLPSIRNCATQATRYSMGIAWLRVAERIQEGESLSDAMAAEGGFPHIVVAMAQVGEETGTMDRALVRAADTIEKRRQIESRVRTALAYPTIVLLMAVAVTAYLVGSLIPKLRTFLGSLGRRLPPLTEAMVDISVFAQTWWIHGLILLIVGVAGVVAFREWPPGRLATDRALFRVPLLGGILRLSSTAGFSRSLSILLETGVRLTEALRISATLHGNRFVEQIIGESRRRVLQGESLAEALDSRAVFLPVLPAMVSVGEASGTLDEVLSEVAKFHEERLEVVVRQLAALVEPAIILVVGGIVGFVYLACFMAIYAIAGGRG